MKIDNIPVPEIYKSSQDFRFFCNWFSLALQKIQFDQENIFDLYDPLRCPESLLWLLCDTMGYKYDDRLPTAFNRLVLVYFMSMIRCRGSKNGVILAAEANLAQFRINMVAGTGYTKSAKQDDGSEIEVKVDPNPILFNRLEDTSIPVNSVYVTNHTAEGYIDVVYFSAKSPIDACIEYVRPVGMYLFQHAGVRYDGRMKISVDARLTDDNDMHVSIGSTRVGHYNRNDYAKMQRMADESNHKVDRSDSRQWVNKRNSDIESDPTLNPGYRAMCSLQLCNNDHIVKSLIDPIFSLGYGPQDVSTTYSESYLKYPYQDRYANRRPYQLDKSKAWNLRYDKQLEESIDSKVYTIDNDRSKDILNPRPAVNPIMSQIGDAMSIAPDNPTNTKYTKHSDDGHIDIVDIDV